MPIYFVDPHLKWTCQSSSEIWSGPEGPGESTLLRMPGTSTFPQQTFQPSSLYFTALGAWVGTLPGCCQQWDPHFLFVQLLCLHLFYHNPSPSTASLWWKKSTVSTSFFCAGWHFSARKQFKQCRCQTVRVSLHLPWCLCYSKSEKSDWH